MGYDFQELVRAHANRQLLPEERRRLRAMAETDIERAAEVAEWDRLHRMFDEERVLRQAAMQPAEPAEEVDEGYRRLQAVAARSEEELRARLVHPVPTVPVGKVPLRRLLRFRRAGWLIAAAALIVAAVALWGGDGAPELIQTAPEDQTLGHVQRIVVITPTISAASPSVSWYRVPGAAGYDVAVVSEAGERILERSRDSFPSTVWELSEAELGILQGQRDALLLRVQARDGTGVAIGSSGDLLLNVK